MRSVVLAACLVIAMAAPSAAQDQVPGRPAPIASPTIAPTASPTIAPTASPVPSGIPDGYQLVVNQDPPFAFLAPEAWEIGDDPPEGVTLVVESPGGKVGSVRVVAHRDGVALKSLNAWVRFIVKDLATFKDLGFKLVYDGTFDLDEGTVGNVEWVSDGNLIMHYDQYLFRVSADLALELVVSWDHSGWDPLWFTIRDSFNPRGTAIAPSYDLAFVEDLDRAGLADDGCEAAVAPLNDALTDLDSRLTVGLTNAEYRAKVGDVQVSHDRIDQDTLAQRCKLLVMFPLERALNLYIVSENRWARCIRRLTCDKKAVNKSFHDPWDSAARLIDDVQLRFP